MYSYQSQIYIEISQKEPHMTFYAFSTPPPVSELSTIFLPPLLFFFCFQLYFIRRALPPLPPPSFSYAISVALRRPKC